MLKFTVVLLVAFLTGFVNVNAQSTRSLPAHDLLPDISQNSWNGLTPLKSTRGEVEAVLGKPEFTGSGISVYPTLNFNVQIRYSSEPCVASGVGKWNVPPGTVVEMSVAPRTVVSAREFPLLTKFSRYHGSHPEELVTYSHPEFGVKVETLLYDGRETIFVYTFGPAVRQEHLRCG